MRAVFDFDANIPQNNRQLFLTVLKRMNEAFARYYTQEFFDMAADYLYQYAVDWYTEQQLHGYTEFPGWDALPNEVWDKAFDSAYEEYDGILLDRAEEGR